MAPNPTRIQIDVRYSGDKGAKTANAILEQIEDALERMSMDGAFAKHFALTINAGIEPMK